MNVSLASSIFRDGGMKAQMPYKETDPKRLIVIPRWSGTPASDWYPWITSELNAFQPRPFDPVVVAAMPDPDEPTIPAWVGRVRQLLGDDPDEIARTVMVGHSVGCQAILRALAELPESVHVNGVLCVAGWLWTDEPWDSLIPWIETPFFLARTQDAVGRRIVVMMSDNDPYTFDWRAHRSAWQERLGASVAMVSGVEHFNGEQYPVILQTLLGHFARKETDA